MKGLDPRMAARLKALSEQEERYAALRRLHLEAAEVARGAEGGELLARAGKQIDVWEANRTCSRVYVWAWRRILRDGANGIQKLATSDAWYVKPLLQNSPFGFVGRR
ncbi:hypothetical protein [Lysobacter soli]|uniref:hypothetical protein n=1 Tax=Lysobacter soli TaxID=453783 RepID=UPI003CEDC53A